MTFLKKKLKTKLADLGKIGSQIPVNLIGLDTLPNFDQFTKPFKQKVKCIQW